MVKRISRGKTSYRARTRRAMFRAFLKWFCYAVVLLIFYLWEVAPMIRGWCPLLIIPLATAAAMREGELAAGVFGVFCGLMLDVASGKKTKAEEKGFREISIFKDGVVL